MFPQLSWEKVRTYSLLERTSKVHRDFLGKPVFKGSSFLNFWESLPDILAVKDFKEVVYGVIEAQNKGKPVIWCIGAHVIKVGLSPVIIDLVKTGMVSLLSMNSAGAIHDVELTVAGRTSEDVACAIKDGTFGMAKETAEIINNAAAIAWKSNEGFGKVLGRSLIDINAKYKSESLLVSCHEANIPVTVHAVIGGDIVHMHPNADGAAIGAASMHDFRLFTQSIAGIGNGGVILNIGSSVVLPVVIEKGISLARNLGYDVSNFMGATFDFIRQYRSSLNPVQRAKDLGGKGYTIIGHHELMIPLLAAAINELKGKLK